MTPGDYFQLAILLAAYGIADYYYYQKDRGVFRDDKKEIRIARIFHYVAITALFIALGCVQFMFLSTSRRLNYRAGQIDALTGKIKYHHVVKDTSYHTENWEEIQ